MTHPEDSAVKNLVLFLFAFMGVLWSWWKKSDDR